MLKLFLALVLIAVPVAAHAQQSTSISAAVAPNQDRLPTLKEFLHGQFRGGKWSIIQGIKNLDAWIQQHTW